MPSAISQAKSDKTSTLKTPRYAVRRAVAKVSAVSTPSGRSDSGAFVAARDRLQGATAASEGGATGWKLSKQDAIKAARLAGVMTPSGKLAAKYK